MLNRSQPHRDFPPEAMLARDAQHNDGRKPRALIVDKRAVMAIEMCRQLARKGYSVTIIGERGSPAFSSRYCARAIPTPPFDAHAEYLAVLRRTLHIGSFDAIFVCNEEVLERILDCAPSNGLDGLVLPAAETVRTALSKAAMLQVAREAGADAPRSLVVADPRDLGAVARELGFPLIVKGDRGEAGQHVRLARNRAELETAYLEIAELEADSLTPPIIQEFVRGAAYSVGGLYANGRALRLCVHRKLVAVPPLGGLTVRGVTERCGAAAESAFRIAEALRYTGLAHLEFIRDSRGKFRFLEINPRVWGTMGIADCAGVDFYTPYRYLAAGFPVAARLDFREGVRFHRILREARMIQRRPSRVFGFALDCLSPSVRSDFEWRDPMPHLSAFIRRGFRAPRIPRVQEPYPRATAIAPRRIDRR